MIHNSAIFLVVKDRVQDLQMQNIKTQAYKHYPDEERQPKRQKHWANH